MFDATVEQWAGYFTMAIKLPQIGSALNSLQINNVVKLC
jgi:hypothetical protein